MNRWTCALLLLLPCQAFAAGYSTSIGDSDIMISGQKTISYRYAFALGNQKRFSGDNYLSLGGTIDNQSTFLTINGTVPDKFSIVGTLSDGTYMGSQANIEIKAKNLGLYLGDISANLSGGEFGSFNKSLNGIKAEGDWGKTKFTLITSQLQSQSKTETFQGNGTTGPYRLEYGYEIIEGSETVKVDGKVQLRNQDYYFSGDSLYFYKFLYNSNTIQISYEYSQIFNLNPGTLSGFRGTTQIGDKISLGTTVFRQTTNKYATGAVYRGLDTYDRAEFEAAANGENGEGGYTFQVQYWPLIDNSDSPVTVYIYTNDPATPAKYWSNQYNQYTQEPGDNVTVVSAKGLVTLKDLREMEDHKEEISRVEVEYYYQISFPKTYAETYSEERLPSDTGDGYLSFPFSQTPQQEERVYGKAYLEYTPVAGTKKTANLYADDFKEEQGAVLIKKSIFGDVSPEQIKEIALTFFYILPTDPEAEADYRANTTVVTLDARAQLTPRIALQGEVGFSSGNRSADELYFAKTLDKEFMLANGALEENGSFWFLYLSRFQGTNRFPLPVEPMSETISLRKTSGTTTTLMRGVDYQLDYSTGEIVLGEKASDIINDPAFDSITIQYKYLDEEAIKNEGDVVTGLGAIVGGTANFDKASFNVNWRTLGRNFNPLGMDRSAGYGSKELSRLTAGVTLRPASYLQLSSNVNRSENVNVVKQSEDSEDLYTENNQINNEMRLSVPGWPSLTLANSRSLAPDSDRISNSITTNYNWKIFNFTAKVGASDYQYEVESGDVRKAYQQNTLERKFTVAARPSSKFSSSYTFLNSIQGTQKDTTTNTTSDSHDLSLEYRPSTRLTLGGGYNVQVLGSGMNIQRGNLNFTNTVSAKTTLRGNITRTMDPSSYYGGSVSDYGNISWDYNYTTHLGFGTSLYLSNNVYGNGSFSRYGEVKGSVKYRPQLSSLKQKDALLTWTNSYRPSAYFTISTTTPQATPTESQTASSSLTLSFRPVPGLTVNGGYELQYNKSTSTGTSVRPFTNVLTAYGSYRFSNKIQGTANLSLSDNARSYSAAYDPDAQGSGYGRKLEGTVGVNYTFSPSVQMNLDWRLIGYQDDQRTAGAGYLGNVITTKLVGTF